jgi:hypothetical protein
LGTRPSAVWQAPGGRYPPGQPAPARSEGLEDKFSFSGGPLRGGEGVQRQLTPELLYNVRDDPPAFSYAQWLTDLGGQVRSVLVLPVRMTIVDRKQVMIPINPENSRTAADPQGRPAKTSWRRPGCAGGARRAR